MKPYKMLRGKSASDRCTNKGIYGSPLYCKCGCQTPQDSDPDINLDGVIVSNKQHTGYADFALTRNGTNCGSINTQYNAVYIDDYEFLGVDNDHIQHLLNQARSIPTSGDCNTLPGETPSETIAIVRQNEKIANDEQDRQNSKNTGWCKKCHSYCYGDCES
jgi:hypothetical protein